MMNLFQIREKEIFETLKNIKDFHFVLIGGYAVNTYTLPRFSVDCDIVIADIAELEPIEKEMLQQGYQKREAAKTNISYYGTFLRYEKELQKNFRVSMDILVKEVLDRQTGASFSAAWIFEHSSVRLLKGKTIIEEVLLRIVEPDALVAMKCVSCRSTDIRDVFMILPQVKDFAWIQHEIQKRTDFYKRALKIKEYVLSSSFKNNLQGVYGYIDEALFEKHKKKIILLCEGKYS